MAREPQVTRTITTTKCNLLCIDLVKCEPYNDTIILPRTFKDRQHLEKAISKVYDEQDIRKAVSVVDTEIVETLYGMSELQFIETAQVLPPRTMKTEQETL